MANAYSDYLDMLAGSVSGEDPFGVAGDDPLVGLDDDDDSIGAVMTRGIQIGKPAQQAALQRFIQQRQQIAKPLAAARAALQSRALTGKQPTTFMACNSAAIVAAGATVAIQVQPAGLIRITEWSIDPATAATFDIQSILVGRINLLQSGQPIPASMFIPNSARPPFESPPLYPGQIMTVNVTNIGGAAAWFRSGFHVVDMMTRV